jgi:MFS transporter, DHA2 family, multidrug resistance protein
VTGARGRWLALGMLCTSLLAIVVDNTIVNVALPTLVRDLDAGLSELQWVVDAYTLVFAGLLLLAGALGDRFGRRRTLLAGLAVFGLGSAAAAFAGSVDVLIAQRAIMGAGAAFIMPATLSLLISVFPDPRERAMAVGIWAATAGLGVALGPVVGGVLLDHFWWGSIFVVNVPLCALAIIAGRRVIPESRDAVARRIDWTGAALSGAGLIALVWAVIEAPSEGWTSAPVLGAGGFAAVALGAFVVQQRRAADPLLDLRLFKDPRFTAASGTIMVLFFALFGFLFLSTQYLQFVLGYSPSAAGVRVLPYAAAMIVFAPLSSKLVPRLGTRHVATAGMLLFATGLAVAATVGASTGYGRLGLALVLMGAGMGLAGEPTRDRVHHGVAPARAGEHRIRGQRHRPRARRRARHRRRRERHVVAVLDAGRQGAARRAPGVRRRGGPRLARRRRPDRRRCGSRSRGVRSRDVAGVDARRARGAPRCHRRLALPAGPRRRQGRGLPRAGGRRSPEPHGGVGRRALRDSVAMATVQRWRAMARVARR